MAETYGVVSKLYSSFEHDLLARLFHTVSKFFFLQWWTHYFSEPASLSEIPLPFD